MGAYSRAENEVCSEPEALLIPVCDPRALALGLQAQRVVDAVARSLRLKQQRGSPINWKRKLKAERESQDEAPVVALRMNQSLASLEACAETGCDQSSG